MHISRSSQVYFAYFFVEGSEIFEIDAELAAWMRYPTTVLECDLDAWVVDGLAVLKGLEEQAETGGGAERAMSGQKSTAVRFIATLYPFLLLARITFP